VGTCVSQNTSLSYIKLNLKHAFMFK